MRKILSSLVAVGLLCLNACADDTPPPQAPAPPPPPPVMVAPPPAPTADTTPPPAPKPSMTDLQTASVKAVSDALNAHDAQKYAAVFTADGVSKSGGGPDLAGRDAIVANIQALFTAFPDLKFAFSRLLVKGNLGVSTWAWTGTDTGGFMGAKPTGRPVGLEGATVATYSDDGLIKELHIYSDNGTLMQQLNPKAKKGSFRAPPTLASSVDIVTAGTGDEDKNLPLLQAMYQAFDDKKLDAASALTTDDTLADDYGAPASIKGVKEWKATVKSYFTAFPDFKQLPLTNLLPIGRFVVAEGVLAGTHKGAFGPLKATGKPVKIHFVDISEVKDGKISRFQTYADSVELLTEVGAIKPPGAKPAAAPDAKAATKPAAAKSK